MTFELDIYNRNAPDEELLADLRKVASELSSGRLTVEKYEQKGRFHSTTIRRRFGNWGNALVKAGLQKDRNTSENEITTPTYFELEEYTRNATDEDLILDLKNLAATLGKNSVTIDEYNAKGKFSASTLVRRFGNWFKVLEKAGLEKTRNLNISNAELFKNLENVWVSLGRQPKYSEVVKPFSEFSVNTYEKRFGGWRQALESFVEYINTDKEQSEVVTPEENAPQEYKENSIIYKHTTKRTINNRLRVLVLIRDGNICRICGRKVTGDDIHIDHIKAWSKGGETVLENLQVLCSKCNLGKSNIDV